MGGAGKDTMVLSGSSRLVFRSTAEMEVGKEEYGLYGLGGRTT